MHSTLLAFDIGTSGLKASLVDENLNIIRNVTTTYPTHHYPDGGCEQEAADWWMSAVRAMMMLRELAPEYVKRVDAIGVSGHMLGCLPMDSEGQTLRPAMIHADTRALAISNALRARYGRDYFYEICGNVLSPASTLCKTLWLKEHEPELYARTVRILQSKDYLVYRLTGHMDTTDMSDASHGLLMNLRTRQYDLDMFRNVGVDAEKFPEIRTSCELAGYLSEEAAGCLGLRAGIPAATARAPTSARAWRSPAISTSVSAPPRGSPGRWKSRSSTRSTASSTSTRSTATAATSSARSSARGGRSRGRWSCLTWLRPARSIPPRRRSRRAQAASSTCRISRANAPRSLTRRRRASSSG